MLRRMLIVLISVVFVLAACGTEESGSAKEADGSKGEESTTKETKAKGVVKAEDIDKMYTNPKDFKGYEVELTGQVFSETEKDDDGVYFQMFADPENSEQNTIVGIEDSNVQVKSEDYVKVTGVVKDVYDGENAFGATIEAPAILATEVEVVDYITVVAPTKETIEVNENITQHGYDIQLQKIELAENQTRVYLKVANESEDPISFYSFNSKILAGNKQLEEIDVYESGLPEIQSEILPGVETEGVIIFPELDEGIEELKYHAEGSSENYELDFKPFVFDVDIK